MFRVRPIRLRPLRYLVAIAALLAVGACGDQQPTAPLKPSEPGLLLGLPGSSPTLLQCPSSESATATTTIGPAGGFLSVGGTSVSIPLGALLEPTTIELTVPASQYVEVRIKAKGQEHFIFESPITVTIDYSRCTRSDLLFRLLTAWEIDPETKDLLERMGGIDNKLTRSVTFSTIHLSGYAIAF